MTFDLKIYYNLTKWETKNKTQQKSPEECLKPIKLIPSAMIMHEFAVQPPLLWMILHGRWQAVESNAQSSYNIKMQRNFNGM